MQAVKEADKLQITKYYAFSLGHPLRSIQQLGNLRKGVSRGSKTCEPIAQNVYDKHTYQKQITKYQVRVEK